jgi:hypothetical protein
MVTEKFPTGYYSALFEVIKQVIKENPDWKADRVCDEARRRMDTTQFQLREA